MTTKTVIEMDYNEVDKLVREHYNQPNYECVAYEEWGNDQAHTFHLDGKLDQFALKDIADFRATGKAMYRLGHLLDGLVADGVLQPGDYVIDISW